MDSTLKSQRLGSFKKLMTVGAAALAATLAQTSPAAAQISLPFNASETWYVCQGYKGTISHGGTFAFDLSIGQDFGGNNACWANDGNVNRSANKQVLSPAKGTVYINGFGSDLVCVDIEGKRSILIGHINRDGNLKDGATVNRGQLLGTVSSANSRNGGFAHIHAEGRNTSKCGGGTRASVPFTEANGFRFDGVGDLGGDSTHFKKALSGISGIPSIGSFVSKATNRVLDAGGQNGNQIYMHPNLINGNSYHQWRLNRIGDSYMIVSAATGKALDAGGNNGNEVYPHPRPDAGNNYHLWKVTQVGDAFLIVSKATGKALDAGGANGTLPYPHPNPNGGNNYHLWRIN